MNIMENQIEIWKDIEGYEGDYQVSNFGRIKSFKRNKETILSIANNKAGYCVINFTFMKKQKLKLVHRLVAECFLGKSDLEVNHKDGDKNNNNILNLEFISARDNCIHRHKSEKTSSEYAGVYWNKAALKWRAKIYLNGVTKHLGYFYDELDAYNAYLKALKDNGIESKYS